MEDQAFYVERKHQCKPPLLRMWKEKAQQGTTENIDLHRRGLFQMEVVEEGKRFWKWRQSQMLSTWWLNEPTKQIRVYHLIAEANCTALPEAYHYAWLIW